MSRKSLQIMETREKLWTRSRGLCEHCGEPIDYMGFEMAHVIPQRKHWLKKYGEQVIHHADNLRATHATARCNNGVSIGNNEHLVGQHAEYILQIIADNS